MNPERRAILLMVCCTLFTSTGQILWKMGVSRIDFGNIITIFNVPFLLGFAAYGMGAILMLIAFKSGELSILYPIIATSYVWVTLVSPFFFSEVISILKWIGIGVIVISVSILGFGSSKKVVIDG